jgi:hypothetical protein
MDTQKLNAQHSKEQFKKSVLQLLPCEYAADLRCLLQLGGEEKKSYVLVF